MDSIFLVSVVTTGMFLSTIQFQNKNWRIIRFCFQWQPGLKTLYYCSDYQEQ